MLAARASADHASISANRVWISALAAFQRQFASDQPKKRRLARPIASDNPHFVPVRYHRRGLLEQRPTRDGIGDVFDAQHAVGMPARQSPVNRGFSNRQAHVRPRPNLTQNK